MNKVFFVSDIFTPNDTPEITYVGRNDLKLEENLAAYCALPKMVVSISGPSKSGKTVLINKVIDRELIIPVIGSGISSPEVLWERALGWMNVPVSTSVTKTSGNTIDVGTKGAAKIDILAAKGEIEGGVASGKQWSEATTSTKQSSGLPDVIKEIAGSDFVIFLDDFHYIAEEHREEIGRQIKVAADNGVKIITASVPHRTDDVVRSNPELRGRVAAVDVGYWEPRHLRMIAQQGFHALNVELAPSIEKRLCEEAMGSPQLMQTICFCLCQVKGIKEPLKEQARLEVTEADILAALFQTSQFTDFTKMINSLHAGARIRGQERKEHLLTDNSKGDVYRAVLMAICADPISMSFTYDQIVSRVKSVCLGESPAGSSVTSCLEQMHKISEKLQPGRPVLSWDGDNLDITDPYFSFFLRSSDKLQRLAKETKE